MTDTTAVTLTRRGPVTLLDLGGDENRWSPDWLQAVGAALDEAVSGEPTALVTTATGKFFSNGLDLEWLSANPGRWEWYVGHVHALLARVLTLPLPTVAAVNGHAFGAGAMLVMAHDFRVMRADRGYLCFPEVDIRIPFTPGMAALIQAKITPAAAVAAMTTGRRYGGPDAQAAGLVDATADEAGLVDAATALVAPLVGKDPTTLGTIKTTMFAAASAALTAG
ncbi:MAG: enoyl-CoA hydratase-related protein [Actinomycetia bacterium]|jgi:enoyl-CoA hydratase/carnithine racemase|nr:enoyl-CoA hydratase-related protein [Actinomycetes bacterium]